MIGELVNLVRPSIDQTWNAVKRVNYEHFGLNDQPNSKDIKPFPRFKYRFMPKQGGTQSEQKAFLGANENRLKDSMPDLYKELVKNLPFYFENGKPFKECSELKNYIKLLEKYDISLDELISYKTNSEVFRNYNWKSGIPYSGDEVLPPFMANEWMFCLYEANDFDKHLNLNVVEIPNDALFTVSSNKSHRVTIVIPPFVIPPYTVVNRLEFKPPSFLEKNQLFTIGSIEHVNADDELVKYDIADYTFTFYSGGVRHDYVGSLGILLTSGISKAENFVNELQRYI